MVKKLITAFGLILGLAAGVALFAVLLYAPYTLFVTSLITTAPYIAYWRFLIFAGAILFVKTLWTSLSKQLEEASK